jgi:hypothetical protein
MTCWDKAAALGRHCGINRQNLRSASMTATRSIGRAGAREKSAWRDVAFRPIALRHEGFDGNHGLESDKKNDQVGLCWRGFRRTLAASLQSRSEHDQPTTTWQSRWPKE